MNIKKTSLMQNISYDKYQEALKLSEEECRIIAITAGLRDISFELNKPGKTLINKLDREGYSVEQYETFLKQAFVKRSCYYKPKVKIAILIGNEQYTHLPKLATPINDCAKLSTILKSLGFVVVTYTNLCSVLLKKHLKQLFELIPEDSYCVLFYAGHGCEICNIKCLLSVDCPIEDIQYDHVLTENQLLADIAKFKPDLCLMLLDMCRNDLDSKKNVNLYNHVKTARPYPIHKNLLIGYSTTSSGHAFEIVQVVVNNDSDNISYELKTEDNVVEGASQYTQALIAHLEDCVDVSTMLDRVHQVVEKTTRKQKPMKVQHGVNKRSLHDIATDNDSLYAELEKIN